MTRRMAAVGGIVVGLAWVNFVLAVLVGLLLAQAVLRIERVHA
ncbi:hypothetical protein HMPREF0063_11945 [Aeromicrobium marinum DSM 15272]|uniref:Uncharacterized protein n=1 Tax=Aeromicrobium marinum DSM 15272 TaxID=585531 RepID=E2SE09_9ACTN|nr:hypothetical protein [Aeromicrobium marinum]EFQ82736.1 hypothetical protein HMPREF0063_11945 [Aeromicrobium marinum DSM 15272]